MSGYGIQESNYVGVNDITVYGDFLVYIMDSLGYIWYYDKFHMMSLLTDFFDLNMCHTGYIYVIKHNNILFQD